LAGFRLLARGISPDVVQPIRIDRIDLATPRRHSANLLHVVALFVILAVFIGGMQVAIDTTAGERERGSLEALLLNPVPPSRLIAGKWLVSVLFGAVSAIVTLLLSAIILPQIPLENVGLVLHLGWREILLMLAIVLPLAPLAAAAQLLVASFARSFKEAQTYLSLLLFVPMIPGFAAQILGYTTAWWMLPIPALAQQVLIGDLLRGEPLAASSMLLAAASCFALAMLALRLTGRLYARERIIFAGQ
jgi:sodium transport system permease protein